MPTSLARRAERHTSPAARLMPDATCPTADAPRADPRSRARPASCRSSDRTIGSPASGSRCARRRESTPAVTCRNRHRARDAVGHRRESGRNSEQLQKCSTIGSLHHSPSLSVVSTSSIPGRTRLLMAREDAVSTVRWPRNVCDRDHLAVHQLTNLVTPPNGKIYSCFSAASAPRHTTSALSVHVHRADLD